MLISELISDHELKHKRAAFLLEKYLELKDRAEEPTSAGDFSEVKAKGKRTREDLYTTMIDARAAWQDAALDELEAQQALFDIFIKLDDPDEMNVLYFRFIKFYTYEQLTTALKKEDGQIMSKRTAIKKYTSGMEHAEEILRAARKKTSTPNNNDASTPEDTTK